MTEKERENQDLPAERGEMDLHMCNDDALSLLCGGVLYGQLALKEEKGPGMYALPFVFQSGIVYMPWKPSLKERGLPAVRQSLAFSVADITRMYQGNFSLATVNCYGRARLLQTAEERQRAYRLFDHKYETLAPFDRQKPLLSLACKRITGRIHAETMQGDFEEYMR